MNFNVYKFTNTPDSWKIKEVVMEAVRHDGYLLKFASDELKNDLAIVEAAIQQNPAAIRYTGLNCYSIN